MPSLILITLLSLLILEITALLLARSSRFFRTFARVLGALLLLALAGACSFGFQASFEAASLAARLPFQLGYGLLGLAALAGAGRIVTSTWRKPAGEAVVR